MVGVPSCAGTPHEGRRACAASMVVLSVRPRSSPARTMQGVLLSADLLTPPLDYLYVPQPICPILQFGMPSAHRLGRAHPNTPNASP